MIKRLDYDTTSAIAKTLCSSFMSQQNTRDGVLACIDLALNMCIERHLADQTWVRSLDLDFFMHAVGPDELSQFFTAVPWCRTAAEVAGLAAMGQTRIDVGLLGFIYAVAILRGGGGAGCLWPVQELRTAIMAMRAELAGQSEPSWEKLIMECHE